MSNRIKTLLLNEENLIRLLTGRARITNLPDDARITLVRDGGPFVGGMRLFVESATFEPVPAAVEPPCFLGMVESKPPSDMVSRAAYRSLQEHRNDWRRHAYGDEPKPADFLDMLPGERKTCTEKLAEKRPTEDYDKLLRHRNAWRRHAYGGPKPSYYLDGRMHAGQTCTEELTELQQKLRDLCGS